MVTLLVGVGATFGAPAAFAAFVSANATFDGIVDIRTTGDATVSFTGLDFFEAFGATSGGSADPGSDGVFFSSEFSPLGEGTATNGGSGTTASSASLAIANADLLVEWTSSDAFTFFDTELELAGTGIVEIDLAYSLTVEGFDNAADAFATAGIEASGTFTALESAALDLLAPIGAGDFITESGVLTLSFEVFGVDPLFPVFDLLTVATFAAAKASVVPVPAAVWLFASALGGIAGFRRRAARG